MLQNHKKITLFVCNQYRYRRKPGKGQLFQSMSEWHCPTLMLKLEELPSIICNYFAKYVNKDARMPTMGTFSTTDGNRDKTKTTVLLNAKCKMHSCQVMQKCLQLKINTKH